MARVRVPETQVAEFAKMLALPDSAWSKFMDVLGQQKPAFSIPALAARVAAGSGLPFRDVHGFLVAFAGMLHAHEASASGPEDTFLEDLRVAISQANDGAALAAPESWAVLGPRIQAIIAQPTVIELSAKTLEVFTTHDRVFRRVRILTDLRPIFEHRSSDKIGAAVVFHTMRIGTSHDKRDEDCFIALDRRDLLEMRKAIDRALAKEAALSTTVGKAGILVLQEDA